MSLEVIIEFTVLIIFSNFSNLNFSNLPIFQLSFPTRIIRIRKYSKYIIWMHSKKFHSHEITPKYDSALDTKVRTCFAGTTKW